MAMAEGGAKLAETIVSEEESRKRSRESGDLSDTEEPKKKKSSAEEPAYGLSCLDWNEEDDGEDDGQGLLHAPSYLWRANSTLKVYFINPVPYGVEFDDDAVNKDMIIKWMNEWSPGESPVPKFELVKNKASSNIRVRFTDTSSTKIGTVAMQRTYQELPTMKLNLTPSVVAKDLDKYVKYTVLHETGHALGFYHEHQHPDKDFFNKEQVISDLATEFHKGPEGARSYYDRNFTRRSSTEDIVIFPYDSNSVMTYWVKESWIKDKSYFNGHHFNHGYSWPMSAVYGELTDADKERARRIYKGAPRNGTSPSNSIQDRLSADSVSNRGTDQGQEMNLPPTTTEKASEYVLSIPPSHHCYLDERIDFDANGVDKDLSEISMAMSKWKGKLAAHLQLTEIDISDIEEEHPRNPTLQRKKALQKWKNKLGFKATYRNLLAAFEEAGHHEAAVAVCTAVKKKPMK